jgi:hypothetical protein
MRRFTREQTIRAEKKFLARVPLDIVRVKQLISHHQSELKELRLNLKHLKDEKRRLQARYRPRRMQRCPQ